MRGSLGQFIEDSVLRDVLKRYMPSETLAQTTPELERFGWRVVRDVFQWGKEAELQKPYLVQVDGWGRRVDTIKVCDAWTQLEGVASEEGLVALGYQRAKYGAAARVYQFAKLYLYSPAASVAHCPLAMTDGAARIIEIEKAGSDPRLRRAYDRLTSTEPKKFWTSGQWRDSNLVQMTERTGGSDVGGTETIAQLQPDGTFALTGYKFFTSATTSQMAFTLARIADDKGKVLEGSRGLSMFFLETRKENGELNNIQICKLKDKLGTRALPTAELELKKTPAILVGDRGKGVPAISTMFNITRIHNAIASIGSMRRSIAIARDYAHRRRAFGKLLVNQPLHLATLADLEVVLRGNVFFTFEAISLLGKLENGQGSPADDALLRLLTPLIKLYTAKESLAAISECIECLGGTGFMEDATPLPRLFRDQQVCTIWEGTTNVLSLDTLRALTRVGYEPFKSTIDGRVARIAANATLSPLAVLLRNAALHASSLIGSLRGNDVLSSEASARELSYFMSVLYITALMGDQAVATDSPKDAVYAERWGVKLEPYLRLKLRTAEDLKKDRMLALDIDLQGRMEGFGDLCHTTHLPRSRL